MSANDSEGAGRSEVFGGPGNDLLGAGQSGSCLIGGRGNDHLFGGPGRDVISGGGGKDIIRGGLRADELRGQAGADTFYARDGDRDRVFGGRVMTRLASTAGSTSCGQSSDSSKRKPADLLLPAALDNGQRSPRKLLDAGRA